MDRQSLERGIIRYGTPSYFFDMDLLTENFQAFREILGARAGLCFAMKANPFLAEQMAEMADRLEVCSPGEFKICRELQITPEKLFLSGVLKKKEEVYEMLEYTKGQSAFTVESPQQFQYLVDWCEESRQTVPVYLRLTSGNQFGMDWQTLLSIVELRKGCPYVQIKGIHFFSGTQKKGTAKIREEILFLRNAEKRDGEDPGGDRLSGPALPGIGGRVWILGRNAGVRARSFSGLFPGGRRPAASGSAGNRRGAGGYGVAGKCDPGDGESPDCMLRLLSHQDLRSQAK